MEYKSIINVICHSICACKSITKLYSTQLYKGEVLTPCVFRGTNSPECPVPKVFSNAFSLFCIKKQR